MTAESSIRNSEPSEIRGKRKICCRCLVQQVFGPTTFGCFCVGQRLTRRITATSVVPPSFRSQLFRTDGSLISCPHARGFRTTAIGSGRSTNRFWLAFQRGSPSLPINRLANVWACRLFGSQRRWSRSGVPLQTAKASPSTRWSCSRLVWV